MKGLELTDKGIKYFIPENLRNINKRHHGSLVYQPVKSMEYEAFPWMVVELKKEGGDEDQCLRQAANASYTCLKLGERLAASTTQEPSPVVALAAVGPEVKIFITYHSKKGKTVRYIYCFHY